MDVAGPAACEAVHRATPGLASAVERMRRRVQDVATAAGAGCRAAADADARCREWRETTDAAVVVLDSRLGPAIRDLEQVWADRCEPPVAGAVAAVDEVLDPVGDGVPALNAIQMRLLEMRRADRAADSDACEAPTRAAFALDEQFKRHLTGPWSEIQKALSTPPSAAVRRRDRSAGGPAPGERSTEEPARRPARHDDRPRRRGARRRARRHPTRPSRS